MLVVLPLYILTIMKIGRQKASSPAILLLLLGIFLSFITPALNHKNPIQYSDVSDAETYVTLSEGLSIKEIITTVPTILGAQYVPYILILRTLFILSFENRYLFISSALLLNFLVCSLSISLVQSYVFKVLALPRTSTNVILWIALLNPGLLFLAISPVRDSLILFSLAGSWFYLSMFLDKQVKSFIIKHIIFMIILGLFRVQYVPFFLILTVLLLSSRAVRPVRNVPLSPLAFSFLLFFSMILILPMGILKQTFSPAGLAEIISDEFETEIRDLLYSGTSKFDIAKRYTVLFVQRLVPNILGRGWLYDLYYYLTTDKITFNYSNVFKATFLFLYDFYRYVILLPTIATVLINREVRRELDLIFWFYLLVAIFYTAKFGAFQPRIRIPIEFLLSPIILVRSRWYIKWLPTFILAAILLGISEVVFRLQIF